MDGEGVTRVTQAMAHLQPREEVVRRMWWDGMR